MKVNLGSGPEALDGYIAIDRWLDSGHHVDATQPPDIQADAHHLPLKGSTVRHLRLSHVIEHLEAPLDALREAARVIEPGGTIYVEVPNANETEAERDEHLYSWTEDTLKQIVERAGFEIDEYEAHKREWENSVGDVHHVVGTLPG